MDTKETEAVAQLIFVLTRRASQAEYEVSLQKSIVEMRERTIKEKDAEIANLRQALEVTENNERVYRERSEELQAQLDAKE